MTEEQLSMELLLACKENNIDDVNYWLEEKKASPIFKKDDWSPLLWAACNGNETIVRALLRHNAHSEYVNKSDDSADQAEGDEQQEKANVDSFGKIPDAKKIGKYTPLHWASYKGHFKVVWLLLKAGLSPIDDQDIYGNTAIHQAAASGNIDVLKCFLSRGVDIDQVNARGDTPLALATHQETRELILKTVKTK
jgi:ankyrin repeat protein